MRGPISEANASELVENLEEMSCAVIFVAVSDLQRYIENTSTIFYRNNDAS